MAVIIKTPEEIEGIKKANQIIARLYKEILPPHIKPGISTKEIDKIVDDYIRSQGAIPGCIGVPGPYGPFPAATCISVNEVVVHGIPSEKIILKEGDIVSIDTVTILDGFYGDAAITYPVGEIDSETKKLLEVTEKAREIGIEMAVVGNRLGDIGHAIQSFVEKNGFSVVRDYAGHGVGKEMHEDPCVANYGRKGRGIKIEEGMVLAIEPMVNMGSYKIGMLNDGWTVVTRDGKKSAHFEHSIAIVNGKPLVLSKLD
ncbi:type I methionyl aminopeptidase [Fusobacterium perfoetens]|uniref:type I methionyl aminopeptidase n=1 Tax=Fusobacterium perfoetens TaxID=852 RepID=UPI000489CAEF|nr:type I methionyl aminopeptidase [Fusobacterium perfoetens]MCI6153338.1 type I methionyl aminopeptidase [Fusobacterium perfoetens]MDY3237155.1 type I methionyl aminopeptidase [Fusobacterium perfoetens]